MNKVKLIPCAVVAVLASAAPAMAYPALEVDIAGGSYISSNANAVLNESVVTNSSVFTVGAIWNQTGGGPVVGDAYKLIMAFTKLDGSAVTTPPSTGSLTVKNNQTNTLTTVNLSSLRSGDPYGIQPHGVYNTLYKAIGFNFTNGIHIDPYNSQTNPGAGGSSWAVNSLGTSRLETFTVDRTNLGNYLIQFDLVAVKSGVVTYFAPFSHDGASRLAGVPEPSTMMIMGTAAAGIAYALWRARKARRDGNPS